MEANTLFNSAGKTMVEKEVEKEDEKVDPIPLATESILFVFKKNKITPTTITGTTNNDPRPKGNIKFSKSFG